MKYINLCICTDTHYIIYTLHSFLYHTFLYFLKHTHKNAFFNTQDRVQFFSSEIIMIHHHHQQKTTQPTIYHQHCVTTIRDSWEGELPAFEISCKSYKNVLQAEIFYCKYQTLICKLLSKPLRQISIVRNYR